MKDTLKEDLKSLIEYHFGQIHYRDHCGRLSSEGELHRACQVGIDSFDTTTFMIRMGSNQHTDYSPRLRRYCKRFIHPDFYTYQ